ncbi:hypothetical protein K438DRAFT_1765571 [Mycena galopus ATCC 62051]|nr:hypothetical protein K438DRAFT_1765571 [Mycena galopus ATCC 62051]
MAMRRHGTPRFSGDIFGELQHRRYSLPVLICFMSVQILLPCLSAHIIILTPPAAHPPLAKLVSSALQAECVALMECGEDTGIRGAGSDVQRDTDWKCRQQWWKYSECSCAKADYARSEGACMDASTEVDEVTVIVLFGRASTSSRGKGTRSWLRSNNFSGSWTG